ncbi:MAG TPA: SH3 domain-containing protein [Planctomycetota bacterium]
MSLFARLSLALSVALALGLAASAQEPPKSGESQSSAPVAEFPFEGEVLCENLNVRLAPKLDVGVAVVSVLKQGEKVVAVGSSGDFLIVRPPRGASVWIYAKHVKKESDGSGSVIVNDAAVRMDSRVNAEKLGALKEGERVSILKEHLGWYQIAAPDAVKYFVSKKYVRFLAPAAGVALVGPEAKEAAGSDAAALAKIREAEGLIDQQRRLIADQKLLDVDFSGVVAAFEEAVGLAKTEPVKKQAENDLNAYKNFNALFVGVKGNLEATQKLLQAQREMLEEKRKGQLSKYDACGYVDTVGLLINRPGAHKLVMSGKIVAFLKVKEGDEEMRIRLNNLYGKYVGVTGTVLKDPEGWLGHRVVTVELAEELTKK